MLFYKMNATIDTNENFPQPREQETYCSFAGTLSEKSESYYQKNNRTHYFFAVTSKEKTITFGAIFKEAVDVENTFYSYLEWLSYQPSSVKIEEITFHAEKTLLATADRNEFIEDDYEILELFEIDDLRRQRIDYGEILLNHIDSKDKLTARTKRPLLRIQTYALGWVPCGLPKLRKMKSCSISWLNASNHCSLHKNTCCRKCVRNRTMWSTGMCLVRCRCTSIGKIMTRNTWSWA